jgi:hypothetical protein
MSFALYHFSDTVADPDLWGHLRFGQDMVRAGSVIRRDDYSYRSAGRLWINHEWLSEVLFAQVYDLAGPPGLIVGKVVVALMLIGLCHSHLTRRGLGPFRSLFLLVVASVPFRLGFATVRPQIFTYVAFLFLLLLLERAITGRERFLWALPLMFALWVNLHGGVLAGIGIIGLWVLVRSIASVWSARAGPPSRRGTLPVGVAAIGGACGLALFCNPYGATLVKFLLSAGTAPRPEISEWAPLALLSLPGLIYLGILAAGSIGLIGSRLPRRPEAICFFVVASALPLISQRHYPLFVLIVVVWGGAHIADVSNRVNPFARSRLAGSRVVAVGCLAASLIFLGLSWPRFGCIRVDPFYFPFPARAVAVLKQSGVRGNIAVPFDWGEYVLWHVGPGVKVSIDGRRETLYSDDAYRQWLDFGSGRGIWDALLKTSSTDLVIAPKATPTVNQLSRTDGWVPLYQDTFCALFARAGFLGIDRIVETGRSPKAARLADDGGGLCFPAGDFGVQEPVAR